MAENLLVLLEREKANILGRFPKLNDWLTPEIWWSIVESLRNDPKLNEVAIKNPNSLISALLTLADWGLKPDRSEAFINVYNIDGVLTAQAQWMWQGGVRRAIDLGVIAHAAPEIIRDGDTIETFDDQNGRHLKHARTFSKQERPVIGSYALFWLTNGLMDYELCSLQDIERAKAASIRQVGKETPAWKYAYAEQAKKTAVRRGLKRMVGKRDSGFQKMIGGDPRFDAETTGEELPPDNLPISSFQDERIGETVPLETAGNANNDSPHQSRGNERPASPLTVVDDARRDDQVLGGAGGDASSTPTLTHQQQIRAMGIVQRRQMAPEELDAILRGLGVQGEFPDLAELPQARFKELLARLEA